VQSAEVRDVGGQQVVWHHAPILRLVPLDDGIVVLEEQGRSMGGFAVPRILRAVGIDDRRWHSESNAAVNASLALPVMLIIALLGDNVIAEEACLFGIGMRDKRLFC
jgi:hypothetical protein